MVIKSMFLKKKTHINRSLNRYFLKIDFWRRNKTEGKQLQDFIKKLVQF
jgi:hypothetical protein